MSLDPEQNPDRRRRALPATGVTLALALAPLLSACVSGAKNAVNVLGAYRSVSGSFKGASVSPSVGVEGLWGLTAEGVGLEGGYSYYEDAPADQNGQDVLKANELFAGVRQTWNTQGQTQPYVAAGANWMSGELTDPTAGGASDSGAGLYVRGGVGFQLDTFQIGFDLRGSLSDAKVEEQSLSYVQAGFFIGLSF